MLQDLQLDSRLVLELPLISNHFDGHCLLCLVVQTLDSLAKASLAQKREHLEAVGDMVVEHHLIVTQLVIVSMVKDAHLLEALFVALHLLERAMLYKVTFYLLLTVLTQVVDFMTERFDLVLFVLVQIAPIVLKCVS